MRVDLDITYQAYIPDFLFLELERSELEQQYNLSVTSHKEDSNYSNFSGETIADMIVYAKTHEVELLTETFVSLATGLCLTVIAQLWSKLAKLHPKKAQGGKIEDKQRVIAFKIIGKNKSIEMLFQGNVDESQAERMLQKAVSCITVDNLKEMFENEDLVENEELPTIKLIYNPETEVWEPEDFSVNRKFMADFMKMVKNNLSN